MVKTLRDRYEAALIKNGEKKLEFYGRKYIKYSRKQGGFYFIGKSGSLRYGNTVTGSIDCGDLFKYRLLGEAEGIL